MMMRDLKTSGAKGTSASSFALPLDLGKPAAISEETAALWRRHLRGKEPPTREDVK